MKKRTSVSALGLRLTLWPVIGIVLLCAGLQYAVYLRTMVQWDSSSYISFEWLLDHEGIYTLGKCSFLLILLVTLIAPRNQARYTLARLRISEGEIALHWSLVFAGWYLLSWAAQLLTVLLLFRQFAPLAELEPLDFFLACYRSRYLRCLLPLGSGWALARTILLCLGWGGHRSADGAVHPPRRQALYGADSGHRHHRAAAFGHGQSGPGCLDVYRDAYPGHPTNLPDPKGDAQ